MTDLEKLLAKIDPSKTIDKVSARADEALNSFSHSAASTTSQREFLDCIFRFFAHVEASISGVPSPESKDLNNEIKAGAIRTVEEIYGEEDGLAIAINMAKTGVNGGLYQVLKDIASHRAKKRSDMIIEYEVFGFPQDWSYEERRKAAVEYIGKFGHILPLEMTQDGGFWLTKNLYRVLCEHPMIIKRMRDMGKL